MNTNLKPMRQVAAMLLLAIAALAGCAELIMSTSPPALQQRIEAARTSADHDALASYYIKEAATARVRAEDHRRMGRAYRVSPRDPREGGNMPAHCNAAAASSEEIASRFDAMAAEHGKMAAQSKP